MSEQPVSLVQATRAIYRTKSPSDEQVYRVFQLMKTGVLPARACPGSPRKWTTTETAVADLLASNQLKQAPWPEHENDQVSLQGLKRSEEAARNLHGIYRGIWRDYFLAVMLRKRMANRSTIFCRLVVVGQAVVLFSLLGLIVGVVWQFASQAPPVEQPIIEHWLRSNTDKYSITHWHDAVPDHESGGKRVRVEYRYQKDSRRWIHTDRTFRVQGETVTQLNNAN